MYIEPVLQLVTQLKADTWMFVILDSFIRNLV